MNIIILLLSAILATSIMLMLRNNKVFLFRTMLIDMAYERGLADINNGTFDQNKDPFQVIKSLPSYSNMLLSIKPLLIENWLTDEEIERIKSL